MVTEAFVFPGGEVIYFNKVGMVGEVQPSKSTEKNPYYYYFNIYIKDMLGAKHVRYENEFEAKTMREVFCGQLAEYLDEHPIDE